HGFVAEVESLLDKGLVADSTAGRAIGYAQVLQGMAGDLTWDEVVDRTITGTRRYVRRQRSWFNRDPRISWIDAAEDTPTQALSLLT
ncbi:tRNA (adenosine(37)-N6)-dimethylallyltransferase MiaA, partial [Acinetobacter courvalinii]